MLFVQFRLLENGLSGMSSLASNQNSIRPHEKYSSVIIIDFFIIDSLWLVGELIILYNNSLQCFLCLTIT